MSCVLKLYLLSPITYRLSPISDNVPVTWYRYIRIFFITGTSSGFGNELVKIVVQSGHKVVASARHSSSLTPPPGASEQNYLAVDLDVTDEHQVDAAFEKAFHYFGRIDVVCNNAGYGLIGEFESLSQEQMRLQMETNFWGVLTCTRKAISVMREKNSPPGGLIQQVTSLGGQRGVPLSSIYCATKWAIEGFTESVAQEVKPEWGIKFTCLEPGGFRTDWAGRSMQFPSNKNPAYDHCDAQAIMEKRNGTQPGDPYKGALAFYQLAMMQDPPLRCLIGSDAYAAMEVKLKTYGVNTKKFETLSNSTDVDGYIRS